MARLKTAPEPRRASRAGSSWLEIRRSTVQGRGGFAARPIRKGTRIIEYTGERISHAEADARYVDEAMGRHHTFLFTVDDETVIDAAVGGSEARFINHSCAPNCEAVIEDGRIYIEALQSIPAGEELFYDYGYERYDFHDAAYEELYACHCGAPSCRGTILAEEKQPARGRVPGGGRKAGRRSVRRRGKSKGR